MTFISLESSSNYLLDESHIACRSHATTEVRKRQEIEIGRGSGEKTHLGGGCLCIMGGEINILGEGESNFLQ